MADSFENLGFLSPEVEDFRREQRRDKKQAFDQVEKVVATAMDDLHQFSGKADAAYLVGLGYWLRCVEACQGTVLLAERGLATTPHSSLRTAFECLFYAAAVWRHPELADKLEASHHTERLKQANQMMKAGAETRVDPERLADLKAVAAEVDPKAPGRSVYEVATQADLLFEHETRPARMAAWARGYVFDRRNRPASRGSRKAGIVILKDPVSARRQLP